MVLSGFCLTSTAYAADVRIMEVQPDLENNVLVIYGTNFAETDMFKFGTDPIPLDTSVGQEQCDLVLFPPPSPLDPGITGYSCVVAAMPDNPMRPSGDYLLEVWATTGAACDSKPSSLTFKYVPSDCSMSLNSISQQIVLRSN